MLTERPRARLVRLLRMIEVVALNPGASIELINQRVSRLTGNQRCFRTTSRDLELLQSDITQHFQGNALQVVRVGSKRMQTSLLRVLRLLYLLSESPRGIRLCELTRRLSETTGTEWSLRTVRRDLETLRSVSLVRQFDAGYALNNLRAFRLREIAGRVLGKAAL